MTAPTSMPVMPAVARTPGSGGGSSAAGSSDGAPAFASALDTALDDALSGAGSAAGRTSGADADQSGEGAGGKTTDDATATAAAVVLATMPPGLWALLSAVTPLTAAPTGLDTTTAAAGLIGAVTGTGPTATAGPDATAAGAGPVPAAPTDPAIPTGPAAAGVPAPATADATTPTATQPPATQPPAPQPPAAAPPAAGLARDAGLTVVLDPTPAPAVAPLLAATTTGATGATAATTATGTTADAAVTTDLLAAPAPAPGDAPDTGSDGTAGAPASSTPATAEATPAADTDSVVTLSGPAAVTPVALVAEAAAAAAPAGNDAPVSTQLGRQFAVLRNAPDGSQTMTVVITPESLGPVTVQVTVTDGTLDLTLHGAHEAGRHALLDALPELRRELEGAGLTFSRLEVDTSHRDAGLHNGQQQLLDARAGQQGSSGRPGQQESRARAWGSSPDRLGEGSPALATDQSTSSGVDVRV
jgi:flagellar hook-length control protein FliK